MQAVPLDGAASSAEKPPPRHHPFPTYHPDAEAADRMVHIFGIPSATLAVLWMFFHVLPHASAIGRAAIVVYGVGIVGMLSASAGYNLHRPGPAKVFLRLVDHAMIFVMIAGTYTPFAVRALPPRFGLPLCLVVWLLAFAGIGLTLSRFVLFRRLSILLYLGMGWVGLSVIRPLIASAPLPVLLLLAAGGVVYSLGTIVHGSERLRYHNAAWHVMVLIALFLHLGAVLLLFRPGLPLPG